MMAAESGGKRIVPILALLYFGVFPAIGSAALTGIIIADPVLYAHLEALSPWMWVLPLAMAIGLGLLPNTVAALALGYSWGMSACGTFPIIYAIALSIGYFIAKILPGEFLKELVYSRKSWRNGLDNLQDEGIKTILLLRLSPIFPFGMTNLVLGWLRFGFWRTMIGSLIGMAPRALALIYLGSKAGDVLEALHNGRNGPLIGFGIALTALAIWGLYKLWNKRRQ